MAHDSLSYRFPPLDIDRLLNQQVPPPQFSQATFDNYLPNPAHPSQQEAVEVVEHFASIVEARSRRWFWRQRSRNLLGIYLDGGYGVGKTHLLAALAHRLGPQRAVYGTFVEFTYLVGALGYPTTRDYLVSKSLVCIDEFELDDPGDTLMMSRLIRELTDNGVGVAATSNTQPEALGQERFAAEDFKREIQGLAKRFKIQRIEGPDYRARHLNFDLPVKTDDEVIGLAQEAPHATLDSFPSLLNHLNSVHPSRYGQLIDGVDLVALTAGHQITNDSVALRFVALVDRLYDRSVPVLIAGITVGEVFSSRLRKGGYRKKYYRAMSRLQALTELVDHRINDKAHKAEPIIGGTQAP